MVLVTSRFQGSGVGPTASGQRFSAARGWHPSRRLGEGYRASGAFVGHRTPGAPGTKAQLLVTRPCPEGGLVCKALASGILGGR